MLQNEIDQINNTFGVMAKDLATKLAFTDMTGDQLESFDVTVTNNYSDTCTLTVAKTIPNE